MFIIYANLKFCFAADFGLATTVKHINRERLGTAKVKLNDNYTIDILLIMQNSGWPLK